jgi:hypothetical protein
MGTFFNVLVLTEISVPHPFHSITVKWVGNHEPQRAKREGYGLQPVHQNPIKDPGFSPRGISYSNRYKLNNSLNLLVCARLTGISVCFLSFMRSW